MPEAETARLSPQRHLQSELIEEMEEVFTDSWTRPLSDPPGLSAALGIGCKLTLMILPDFSSSWVI